MADLESRIARLEAESQIRQLVARYSFDIDDRRVDAVRALFADDAVLGWMADAGLAGVVARRLPAEAADQLGVTLWLATKPAVKVN